MSGNRVNQSNGAMKKNVAYWQNDWISRVMANGHNPQAKLLFMRIASFGEKGCWMNNETFCEDFNKSPRTIRRAITSLWSKGDVIVTGWDGHGRKIYASGHPKVKDELNQKFNKAMLKGKIKDREEYNAKIRLRFNEADVKVEAQVKHKKEKKKVIKGLAYYKKLKTKS